MIKKILIPSILTLLIILLVHFHLIKLGKEGEWVWKYHKFNFWWRAFFPISFFLLFFLLLFFIKDKLLPVSFILFFLLLFSFSLQVSFEYFSPIGMNRNVLVLSLPWMGGYFTEAMVSKCDRRYFRTYPQNVSYKHAKLHPPLNMLICRGCLWVFYRFPFLSHAILNFSHRTIYDASRAFKYMEEKLGWKSKYYERATLIFLGILLPFLASLGVIPLYLLLKEKGNAFLLVAFYPLIPSLLLFSPGFEQILPLFVILALYFFYQGGKNRFWAGFWTGLGMLSSLSIGLIFLFLILLSLKERNKKESLLWMGGGFLLIHFLFWIFTGFSILNFLYRLLPAFTEKGRAGFVGVTAHRSYPFWVLYDPLEFLIFAGIPLSYLFLKGLGKMEKNYGWSFLAIFLFLNFSGISLSEVARLWMFLYPLFFLPAVEIDEKNILIWLLLLQFLQSLFFQANLDVFTLNP